MAARRTLVRAEPTAEVRRRDAEAMADAGGGAPTLRAGHNCPRQLIDHDSNTECTAAVGPVVLAPVGSGSPRSGVGATRTDRRKAVLLHPCNDENSTVAQRNPACTRCHNRVFDTLASSTTAARRPAGARERVTSGPADQVDGLDAIAPWLADWAQRNSDRGHNPLALGDVDVGRMDDLRHQAFTSFGVAARSQLDATPPPIFDDPGEDHVHDDRIAWFPGANGVAKLSTDHTGAAETFDFVAHVVTSTTGPELTWRLPDRHPPWAECAIRRARDGD